MPEGVVALWQLDEDGGDVAHDASGSGNDGIVHGAEWVSGKSGSGLSFDGVNDYVGVSDDDSLDFGTGDFTIGIWFKNAGSTGTHQTLVAKDYWQGESPSGQYKWILYLTTDSGGTLSFSRAGAYQALVYGGGFFGSNTWYYAVVKREGNAGYLYLDGDQVDYEANWFSGYSFSNDRDLYVGARNGGAEKYFKGIIDEVVIYNRALTAEEIREQYDSFSMPKLLTS